MGRVGVHRGWLQWLRRPSVAWPLALCAATATVVSCHGDETPADDGGEGGVDSGTDGAPDESTSDGSGDAAGDGGTPLHAEAVALVARSVSFTPDRLCDLDGDGVSDNAFAELGGAGAASATMLWNALGEGALERGYGPGLFFPILEDGGESTLIALSGDGTALGGELRAPYESMDYCGEPVFFYRGELVDGGRVSLTGPGYPVLLSDAVADGAAQVTGTVSVGPTGVTVVTEECLAPTIASLGRTRGPTQTNGLTLLEVLVAGGSVLGMAGSPGLSPDLDWDGDGLERVLLDGDGRVARCVDGDSTVIEGRDCWSDDRMADAFALPRRATYEETDFAGRFVGWLGYCEGDYTDQSLFGEGWNASGYWQISTGYRHTCLRSPDGSVRCWGENRYGRLGYGHTVDVGHHEPACAAGVVDLGEPALWVIASGWTTCAIVPERRVKCWGALGLFDESELLIGDDETAASAPDLDLGAPVQQLVSSSSFSCALVSGGRVRCWGDAGNGEMGHGHTRPISLEEAAAGPDVPIGGRVLSLAGGGRHTCALLEGGAVRCWGFGLVGQLGYGNTEDIGDDDTPAGAGDVSVGGPAVAIAAGATHSCALLAGGAVRCWGEGRLGALGYGNTETIGDDETPAEAGDVPVGAPVEAIAAGGSTTCALLAGGAVRCWGYGTVGQLGYGNQEHIGDDETPEEVGDVDLGGPALSLSVGHDSTCALLAEGAVRCWGGQQGGDAWATSFNSFLGYGDGEAIGDDETPASAGDVPLDCFAGVCGNGVTEGMERCDDGNTASGDGCLAGCQVEDPFACDDGSPSVCHETVCGDGVTEGIEVCDDGNGSASDGCSPSCREETGWGCSEPGEGGTSECVAYCVGGYPTLTSGVSTTGDTTSSLALTRGSCGGEGPEDIYVLEVPEGGVSQVEITTDFASTEANTVVYLREVCGNPAMERGCDDDGGEREGTSLLDPERYYLYVSAVTPGTYYVFVDSFDSASAGAYEVLATVTPM